MTTHLDDISIIHLGRDVCNQEWKAIQHMGDMLDDNFVRAIKLLSTISGRIIITGIGKSAIIAQKVVATMNSTGSPALFMHAADAVHGDLGMIQGGDAVIIISKSGNTSEIKLLVPLIQNFGNKIIAICGNVQSYLATHADIYLDTTVSEEACPNNLAPTTSTTAQLVMGDALAVVLLRLKGFRPEDFARYHPGGALGKQLYLRVHDLMNVHNIPTVYTTDDLRRVIIEISTKRLGATIVTDGDGTMVGIITDGDLRRMLETHTDIHTCIAGDIMTATPRTIHADAMAVDALSIMRQYNITQLPVIDDSKCVGIVHIHDLIREGIV